MRSWNYWVNRKDLKVESDVANWAQICDKCDSEKQKYRQELTPNTECQRCRVFVRNDLVGQKIKSCRKSTKRFLEFKKTLGLDPDVVTCDEQDVIKILNDKFEGETIITQHSIKNKRLDAYMPEYKIGIEVDKYNHEYRNFNYEESRTKIMKLLWLELIQATQILTSKI